MSTHAFIYQREPGKLPYAMFGSRTDVLEWHAHAEKEHTVPEPSHEAGHPITRWFACRILRAGRVP
jgi:hypothetical protein